MKRMLLVLTTLGALALSGCSVNPASMNCQTTEGSVPAENVKAVRVVGKAGALEVHGKPGLTEIKVKGTACSNDREMLSDIQVRTETRGDEVRVEAQIPSVVGLSFGRSAYLDLVLEVPESLVVKADDDSGDTLITGVAAVDLTDGSGSIEIEDVAGDVTIQDDSGDIRIRNVGGKVVLRDDSGNITVDGVAKDVIVESDDSGDIDVSDVGGNFPVMRDGSGSIRATDVKGDFTVERDGSGDINYSHIGGKVRVPRN